MLEPVSGRVLIELCTFGYDRRLVILAFRVIYYCSKDFSRLSRKLTRGNILLIIIIMIKICLSLVAPDRCSLQVDQYISLETTRFS